MVPCSCWELHLVKLIKARKKQITSQGDALGWVVGPDSPFALSRESHIRWATMFHSEAGKRQDMPGPFQPCGGLHFFFKHLWVSQATVMVMLGWKGDVAQILERATKQQWGPPLIHNRSTKMAQQQMGKKRCSYRREGLLCFKYTSFLWSYYFFVNPIFVGSPSRFCSCISLHSLWAAHSTYLFLCKEWQFGKK